MACTKAQKAENRRLREEQNKALIQGLMDKGKVTAAAFHRHLVCATSNECGKCCDWFDVDAGHNPDCIDPATGKIQMTDLYAAHKRADFTCPKGRF